VLNSKKKTYLQYIRNKRRKKVIHFDWVGIPACPLFLYNSFKSIVPAILSQIRGKIVRFILVVKYLDLNILMVIINALYLFLIKVAVFVYLIIHAFINFLSHNNTSISNGKK
jgi:hypothetical protein